MSAASSASASAGVADVVFEYLNMQLVEAMVRPYVTDASAYDAAYRRVESIGFSAGVRIAERMCRSTPKMTDQLVAIKFLCKEAWTALFGRAVDKLQTNHRVRALVSAPALSCSHPPPPVVARTGNVRAARQRAQVAAWPVRGRWQCRCAPGSVEPPHSALRHRARRAQ